MDADRQKRLWDYWQTARPDSFAGSRARLRHLARRAGTGRVLNIGIGDGGFEEEALRRGAEVHSLDPSEEAVAALRERLGLGDRARSGFGQAIPWEEGTFDAVVASEVFEHLDEATLDGTLSEIRRVLRPGGRLLGTVPARENLAEQTVRCPHCDRTFHRWGHERAFDEAGVRRLLAPRFRVLEAEERVFVTWRALNWKGKAVAAVRLLLSKVGVRGSSANLLFAAERPPE